MSANTPVLFSEALAAAIEKTTALAGSLKSDLVIVRDLLGRIRVIVPARREELVGADRVIERFGGELSQALGAYGSPPGRTVVFLDDLTADAVISRAESRRLIAEEGSLKVWLLDRQIIGQDWTLNPLVRSSTNPRATFFGIKGGVGRSTALVSWAWRLAKSGKNVLVFDLDLESPGVSSTLLPLDYLPDYGIVDWFVEDGVGQAEMIEHAMVAVSPFARDLSGNIHVVPAFGRLTSDYLPKLARCYAEFTERGAIPWAVRVQGMVEAMELRLGPDVAFLDSRAGLHDIAAVLVTRMGADTFLFAVDSPQTWAAYGFLFGHWGGHPNLTDFRQHLQIVAGMVPETGRAEYLERFTESSWDLFREHLYDAAAPDDSEAFSFDLASKEAPHYPLTVFWHRALQEFNPSKSDFEPDEQMAEEAMGDFIREAENIVFSEGVDG